MGKEGRQEGLYSWFYLVAFNVTANIVWSSDGFGTGKETWEFRESRGLAGFGGC